MEKETFFELERADRESVIRAAAQMSGRAPHLLEKDVWVVWTLNVLFESRFGPYLVFKGGTSLSKVHKAIDRFSEDVDVTYDIRELVPSAKDRPDALPETSSKARKWTDLVSEALPHWVDDEMAPLIRAALERRNLLAKVEVKGSNIEIHYENVVDGYEYVRPRILLEFGGRSTGEPCDEHDVECDAAAHLPDIVFPTARPRTMRAERTFWEKATAVHGFCIGGRLPGDAIARHWLDVHHLAAVGVAARAAADADLAQQVADHKRLFFKVTTPSGPVDYRIAIGGGLVLTPDAEKLPLLADDYARMIDARLPNGETAPSFEDLMASCARIAADVNEITGKKQS